MQKKKKSNHLERIFPLATWRLGAAGQCCSTEIMELHGWQRSHQDLRHSRLKSVKSLTPIQFGGGEKRGGGQNYILHIQSPSRASRCFHRNNVETGKQQQWGDCSPRPHQNSAPTGHMRAFPEQLPLSSEQFSGYRGTSLNSNPLGAGGHSIKDENLPKIAAHFVFISTERAAHVSKHWSSWKSDEQTFHKQTAEAMWHTRPKSQLKVKC